MSVGWGKGVSGLKNVPRQVLIFRQFAEILLDILPIDAYMGAAAIGGIEGNGFQKPFHDGVQASRADIFGALIHLEGHFGEPLDT
jgi:hypothetical protein